MKISKESKLYKLVYKMSSTFPFAIYMEAGDWSNSHPSSFNDVCTFVRHFLLTIFIVIPAIILMTLSSIGVAYFLFVHITYEALSGSNPAGYINIVVYAILLISYLVLLMAQHINRNAPPKVTTNKEHGVMSQIINVVKEKNSKICKKIDIE